ncbi:MAG: hypothetical protein ACOY5Y_00815 [Pseudomonadota bacterium]
MTGSESAILTPDQVRDLVSEVTRAREEKRRADARLEEAERRLSALEVLIGTRRIEEIVGATKAVPVPTPTHAALRGGNASAAQAANQGVEVAWTDWIVEQVTAFGGQATSQMLVDAARADPRVSDRFKRTPNGYYNAVSRVLGREQIKKVGRILALPNVEVSEPGSGEASPKGGPLFN